MDRSATRCDGGSLRQELSGAQQTAWSCSLVVGHDITIDGCDKSRRREDFTGELSGSFENGEHYVGRSDSKSLGGNTGRFLKI